MASQIPNMNHIQHIWDQTAIHVRDMDNPPKKQQQFRCVRFKTLVEGTHDIKLLQV